MGFRYSTGRLYKPKAVAGGELSGWWNNNGAFSGCIAAYKPLGAASYAASLLDLSGTGNNASEGVAPDWDTNVGWTGNATSWLETGVTIDSNNGYSILIKHESPSSANYRAWCGTLVSSGYYDVAIRYANYTFYIGDASESSGSAADCRLTCLAGSGLYRLQNSNQTLQDAVVESTPGTPSGTMKLFTGYHGGTRLGNGLIMTHVAIYNIVLTKAQVQSVYDAL